MAAHKSPAFQFYPDDFLGSGKVGTMTTDEVGAYTLLLCLEWNETGFVFDEEELARWCRMSRAKFRKAWARVSRCFEERDGRMYNPRLQKEREKQAEWREKSAKGGRASAQAKAKGGARVVQPPSVPNANTPVSSLQSPSPVTTTAGAGAPPEPVIVVTDAPPAPRKSDPLPKPLCDAAFERFVSRIGPVDYGRFRKALLPAYKAKEGPHPTLDELYAGIEAFREARAAEGPKWFGSYTVEKFAQSLHEYIRLGLMPLMNEWGEPTERGRAAKVVAA